MSCKILKIEGSWEEVKNACRTTISLEDKKGEPKLSWIYKLLQAEHSPIREITIKWEWRDIPYWVHTHLVRHHIGIQYYVSSQRDDRQPKTAGQAHESRKNKSQSELVTVKATANLQAILNISRKRLCKQASSETTQAWLEFLMELNDHMPEVTDCTVPECIYRGFCPEMKSCGWVNTEVFEEELETYRNLRNEG